MTDEISRMYHTTKIDGNFPPLNRPVNPEINKIVIQLKSRSTYGGTIWSFGVKNSLDANGYYWDVPDGLIKLAVKATQLPSTTTL